MKKILYILLPILLIGCNNKPWNVLSHEEMVDVLFDVHLAEATINASDPYASRIEKQEYYNSVFKKYDITKEEFDKSVDWYAHHPEKMVLIYEDIKLKVDDFKIDVEDYKYHPEAIPTHNDSIDTFDLWYWRKIQHLSNSDNREICLDSLHFRLSDKEYLDNSEEVIFKLKMSVEADSIDTLFFTTRLVYCYDDKYDTLQCTALADSIYRNYYFRKLVDDTIHIDSILIELVDSVEEISKVNIDSVELLKVYNNYENPISYRVKREIENRRDSILKEDVRDIPKDAKFRRNVYKRFLRNKGYK